MKKVSLITVIAGIVCFALSAAEGFAESVPESMKEMVLRDVGFYKPIEKALTPQLFISQTTLPGMVNEQDASARGVEKTILWRDKFFIPNGYLKKAFKTKSEQGQLDWGEYDKMWSGGVDDLKPTEKLSPYLKKSREGLIYVTLAKRVLQSVDYSNRWRLNDLDTWSFTYTYYLEPVISELPRIGPFKGKGTAMMNPATGQFETATIKDVGERYGSTLGESADKEYTAWLEKRPASSPSSSMLGNEKDEYESGKISTASLEKNIQGAGIFSYMQTTYNLSFDAVWNAANKVLVPSGFWARRESIIKSEKDKGILVTAMKEHARGGGNFRRQYLILIDNLAQKSTAIKVKCLFYEQKYNRWTPDTSNECNNTFINRISDELQNSTSR